ncbi:MAG: hypothetical protein LBH60_05760 [Prevotellaceae bacterium]|nr:hypothetical protein [Prevotellaceae bacterium]
MGTPTFLINILKSSNQIKPVQKQIRDCRYYETYLDRKVTLMTIAFAGKEVKCRTENAKIKT